MGHRYQPWKFDPSSDQTLIELCPEACRIVAPDEVGWLEAYFGCILVP